MRLFPAPPPAACGVVLIALGAAAPARAQWLKTFGGPGTESGRAVAVDFRASVYVAGWFTGTTDFDPDHAVSGDTKTATGASTDGFVAKYNPAGVLQFVKHFGGANGDAGWGVATDTEGSAYVAGQFSNANVDFDRDRVVAGDTKTAVGSFDAFVAKYNPSGALVFVKQIGGPSSDQANGVFVDAARNVYVTGSFIGTDVDFDLDNVVAGDTRSAPGGGAFVAKYNASGVLQWVKPIGVAGGTIGYGVAVDAAGQVYATGKFEGTNVDFDVDNAVAGDTQSSVGEDAYLARYSAGGVLQAVKTIRGSGDDVGYGLSVDAAGRVNVTGRFSGSNVDFDRDNAVPGDTKTAPVADAFVARYDAAGVLQFVKQIRGIGSTIGFGVGTDASGALVATGTFNGANVDFDLDNAVPGDTKTVGGTSGDAFVVRYDAAGLLLGVKAFGGTGSDAGVGLATDAIGNVYVAGAFDGTNVDFDPDLVIAGDTRTATLGDAFVLRYGLRFTLPAEYARDEAPPFVLTGPVPAPFAAQARMTLTVASPQGVRAVLYDVLGRAVAVLYAGPVQAGEAVPLVLDGARLPTGVYVVCIAGETFSATRAVTRGR